ncbi:LysR family transcriptional regulator [Tsukamurella sp. 8F]|uniref:LysR family transcriptional regulator n=1 Tax=unclassified Tsukamurella TaxID=2633480 RepID=UPI0023B89B4C|nr:MULTISPECIES: LysR family transcriptional regulator [unclassified Tsukamurella]MDF0532304.1 LysR family transcriptional regulator [Tsukamurella sp. 8J]MDF0588993.1 LysR family transcriptional regulator [Tsukamurella sp. 8F]
MHLDAVRTFVAVADSGGFQAAADDLGVSQQAASKRVASLESQLGTRLLVRSARGTGLTADGAAFLPHAREMLRAGDLGTAAVGGDRPLRVDVLSRRIATAGLVLDFHRARQDMELDVVALAHLGTDAALSEVASGAVDLTFRSLRATRGRVPEGLCATRAVDDAHAVLVGPRHPLATTAQVTPAQLARHPIWMPGMADEEPIGYYEDLAAAFGLTIDTSGPAFGVEAQLAEIAQSDNLATFVGEGARYHWPAEFDLRRIPVVGPAPVYPLAVVWRAENRHPALAALVGHVRSVYAPRADTWVPEWATASGSRTRTGP